MAQQLILINNTIGLRIDEILSITVDDIHKKSDHVIINTFERKKKRERPIVLDLTIPEHQKTYDALNERVRIVKEGVLFPDKNRNNFNYALCVLTKTNSAKK